MDNERRKEQRYEINLQTKMRGSGRDLRGLGWFDVLIEDISLSGCGLRYSERVNLSTDEPVIMSFDFLSEFPDLEVSGIIRWTVLNKDSTEFGIQFDEESLPEGFYHVMKKYISIETDSDK